MSTPREKHRIRRIAVALRGQAVEARLLGSVAALAREAAAELSGVFLEDIDLLQLAELPLAIEICRGTNVRRSVRPAELARQLAAEAAAAERVLAQVAEGAGVAWSFRIARGVVTALLSEAAAEADITLIPATRGLPWVYGEAVTRAAGSRDADRSAVAVLFNRSASARRALDVGLRLATAEQRPLTIILTSASRDAGERLRQQAEQVLAGRPARFHMLIPTEPARLLETLREQRADTVVVPSLATPLATEVLRAVQRLADRTALLVR